MTVAPFFPPMSQNAFHVSMRDSANMLLPRFQPIAVNPVTPMPQDAVMHSPSFRTFHTPDSGHSGPVPPSVVTLDHIEIRLKQLEQEDAERMAARSHLLAIRKREDEDFRRVTESAEAEEEDLRRQRKRLKRESMGLGLGDPAVIETPPLRPTPPRRLSETNAATTLAFFKQQSPHDPRQTLNVLVHAPTPTPEPIPTPVQASAQPLPLQPIAHHPPAVGLIRRKQKYTVKNIEAWGERHGRPAAHDPSGRALWKRPSDGKLVYLTCPVSGCGKTDFVTLHGFMCHLTKKHKDRSLGSQSRALEICGVVFNPRSAPTPALGVDLALARDNQLETIADSEPHRQEMRHERLSDEDQLCPVKTESADEQAEQRTAENTSTSARQSISSIIHNSDDPLPTGVPNEENQPRQRTDPQLVENNSREQ